MKTVKVTVIGGAGRMGSRIIPAINETDGIELVGAIEKPAKISGFPIPGTKISFTPSDSDDLPSVIASSDVVIDVSGQEAFMANAKLAVSCIKPMVIGSTGLDDEARHYLDLAAEWIPIVLAPNFSVGANAMFALVAKMTAILGDGYDVEIIEIHHDQKKDAPSGTADRLAEIVAGVRGQKLIDVACYGRHGMGYPRPKDQIGIHSLRASDVVGEHTVTFFGPGERIELVHRVSSRDAFAQGFVRAAEWAPEQNPGLYDMQDVLGLK
ncbi:MAG: 4-hydroxy-tetrahydrodipicolinate reductase [Patescibacteria group bacterium]|nr:4-hydroxy-tetrahydrodipicolinate reductase [Patescibacteria group bacterium]MDD5294423.1 4-hydroxy-tetrahydrodipicolinate reductase [Patescibacteria group bacterium]MDD5554534.1 4-hydroxy-tetrahydrodipicolinate reductase [Patescibacteria group bacterium]